MNRLNKKQKFLTAAFAIFLVAILTGVTYAFFTFDTNSNFVTVGVINLSAKYAKDIKFDVNKGYWRLDL